MSTPQGIVQGVPHARTLSSSGFSNKSSAYSYKTNQLTDVEDLVVRLNEIFIFSPATRLSQILFKSIETGTPSALKERVAKIFALSKLSVNIGPMSVMIDLIETIVSPRALDMDSLTRKWLAATLHRYVDLVVLNLGSSEQLIQVNQKEIYVQKLKDYLLTLSDQHPDENFIRYSVESAIAGIYCLQDSNSTLKNALIHYINQLAVTTLGTALISLKALYFEFSNHQSVAWYVTLFATRILKHRLIKAATDDGLDKVLVQMHLSDCWQVYYGSSLLLSEIARKSKVPQIKQKALDALFKLCRHGPATGQNSLFQRNISDNWRVRFSAMEQCALLYYLTDGDTKRQAQNILHVRSGLPQRSGESNNFNLAEQDKRVLSRISQRETIIREYNEWQILLKETLLQSQSNNEQWQGFLVASEITKELGSFDSFLKKIDQLPIRYWTDAILTLKKFKKRNQSVFFIKSSLRMVLRLLSFDAREKEKVEAFDYLKRNDLIQSGRTIDQIKDEFFVNQMALHFFEASFSGLEPAAEKEIYLKLEILTEIVFGGRKRILKKANELFLEAVHVYQSDENLPDLRELIYCAGSKIVSASLLDALEEQAHKLIKKHASSSFLKDLSNVRNHLCFDQDDLQHFAEICSLFTDPNLSINRFPGFLGKEILLEGQRLKHGQLTSSPLTCSRPYLSACHEAFSSWETIFEKFDLLRLFPDFVQNVFLVSRFGNDESSERLDIFFKAIETKNNSVRLSLFRQYLNSPLEGLFEQFVLKKISKEREHKTEHFDFIRYLVKRSERSSNPNSELTRCYEEISKYASLDHLRAFFLETIDGRHADLVFRLGDVPDASWRTQKSIAREKALTDIILNLKTDMPSYCQITLARGESFYLSPRKAAQILDEQGAIKEGYCSLPVGMEHLVFDQTIPQPTAAFAAYDLMSRLAPSIALPLELAKFKVTINGRILVYPVLISYGGMPTSDFDKKEVTGLLVTEILLSSFLEGQREYVIASQAPRFSRFGNSLLDQYVLAKWAHTSTEEVVKDFFRRVKRWSESAATLFASTPHIKDNLRSFYRLHDFDPYAPLKEGMLTSLLAQMVYLQEFVKRNGPKTVSDILLSTVQYDTEEMRYKKAPLMVGTSQRVKKLTDPRVIDKLQKEIITTRFQVSLPAFETQKEKTLTLQQEIIFEEEDRSVQVDFSDPLCRIGPYRFEDIVKELEERKIKPKSLELKNVQSLEYFILWDLFHVNLSYLDLTGSNLSSLPKAIENCRIQRLVLEECQQLTSLAGPGHSALKLPYLEVLSVDGCSGLREVQIIAKGAGLISANRIGKMDRIWLEVNLKTRLSFIGTEVDWAKVLRDNHPWIKKRYDRSFVRILRTAIGHFPDPETTRDVFSLGSLLKKHFRAEGARQETIDLEGHLLKKREAKALSKLFVGDKLPPIHFKGYKNQAGVLTFEGQANTVSWFGLIDRLQSESQMEGIILDQCSMSLQELLSLAMAYQKGCQKRWAPALGSLTFKSIRDPLKGISASEKEKKLEWIKRLSHFLNEDLSVHSLGLIDCQIEDEQVEELIRVMKKGKLLSLDLASNPLSEAALGSILEAFTESQLTHIGFSDTAIGGIYVIEKLASYMTHSPHLKSLDLSKTGIPNNNFITLFEAVSKTNLETLNLSGCGSFDDNVLQEICPLLPFNGLTHMDLSKTSITKKGAAKLLASLREISSLSVNLAGNGILAEELPDAGEDVMRRLKL